MKDVRKGDHLYFQHKTGPRAGRVLCHGKHGITLETDDGQRQQVYWKHVLGHKERVTPAYRIVDQGADGAIVEEQDGKRVFIQGLQQSEEQEVKNDKPTSAWETLEKSTGELPARVLFFKSGIANRPGLRLEDVTDKAGHHTKRWKRSGIEEKQGREPAGAEHDKRGSKQGYGTRHMEPGDTVSFSAGNVKGQGKIVAAGKDGATVRDAEGREHKVLWSEVTDHRPAKGSKQQEQAPHEVRGSQNPIAPGVFVAAKYFEQHNNPAITPEEILKSFPPDTKQKMDEAVARLASIEQTIDVHKKGGGYSQERQKLHDDIMFNGVQKGDKFIPGLLSPERVKAATPEKGQQPTFMMLGGRGGSGKSWFEGKVYDPDKAIVLDADHIKSMLPEYEGWNAHQVHEESSDVLEETLRLARDMGLNVVLDATMKTAKSAIKKVQEFKGADYRIEAHYMHLPRQEAAKRAVGRFLGKSKRLVPIEVILGNTTNEASFDEVRKLADKWSFRDNNVPEGQEPILISQSGEEKPMQKSERHGVILFLRRA